MTYTRPSSSKSLIASVCLTVGRPAEKGDLPVECVSENVRDLQIEAEAGADDVLRLKLTFTIHTNPCGGERPVEDAPEVVDPLNAVDDPNGDVVRVQNWGGRFLDSHQNNSPISPNVGTQSQYNQMPAWPATPNKSGGRS